MEMMIGMIVGSRWKQLMYIPFDRGVTILLRELF